MNSMNWPDFSSFTNIFSNRDLNNKSQYYIHDVTLDNGIEKKLLCEPLRDLRLDVAHLTLSYFWRCALVVISVSKDTKILCLECMETKLKCDFRYVLHLFLVLVLYRKIRLTYI